MRVTRLLAVSFFLAPTLLSAQRPEPSAVTRNLPPGAALVVPGVTAPWVSRADTDSVAQSLFGPGSDLNLQLDARIEAKTERDRNERCNFSQFYDPGRACNGTFAPNFDFQFSVKSTGTVANHVHVDVDYDSQREFDASNNISLVYAGNPGARLQQLQIGNVSFDAPPSRFITAGIPTGNYGLQAIGQLGPLNIRAIAAQQTGNVVQDRDFEIGDSAYSNGRLDIADWQVEARRFFFTVDPRLFKGDYPNIDLLNRGQLQHMAAGLPDTLRPTRVLVYRLQYGTQPRNPNGPRFQLNGSPSPARQTYDLLREGVDYYMDPSLLWFALVRPLNPNNERLVVAYNVRINGRDTVWVTTGGTPDVQATAAPQYANLVWDPSVNPGAPAFDREIRSVYRIGGEDLDRRSVQLRVFAGTGDQERPIAGPAQTYLQMFGLAQLNNSQSFDVENRLWPRPTDPNVSLNAGAGDPRLAGSTKIIHDYFLVMPSLRPFAERDSGLVAVGNPSNDAIYTTPDDYLVSSSQHPASVYRLHVQYETRDNAEAGTIVLGSVQIRRNSERILLDGVPLTRDLDYRIDYDLGRVTFFRPDTLFNRRRTVSVRYEENPLFAPTPTSIFGLTSALPLSHGIINFTAISQSQQSAFTRPQLGFEPAASLIAGVNGQFSWQLPGLTSALRRFTSSDPKRPSLLTVTGELAASHPLQNANQQAYIESFEGSGGINVNLADGLWYYSSLPALGQRLPPTIGGALVPSRMATMAWQNNGTGADGKPVTYTITDIDPLAAIGGNGFAPPETMLWMTLYPLAVGGSLNRARDEYQWHVSSTLSGRRFRSIRTVLSPTGIDLTNVQYLQFWTLVDTSVVGRSANPALIFDLGTISENSYTFAPETLYLRPRPGGGVDSVYAGKRAQGLDHLDTELDPFTRTFNVSVNDTGLPGDLIDTLVVVDPNGTVSKVENFAVCQGQLNAILPLGDTHANCTVHNNRLDSEDIDQDGVLNIDSAHRESESILRYVVDLSDPTTYTRIGNVALIPDTVGGVVTDVRKEWVLVKVPFNAPNDSLNAVLRRRMQALRITMVSGAGTPDNQFVQLPIDQLQLVGAPWLARNDQTLTGIAGDQAAGGYVITSLIGTTDRDSVNGLFYVSPPGVTNAADTRAAAYAPTAVQINEQSLRIQAGNLPVYGRAEAYYRFPSGQQNFMGYQQLRLWARGRNHGWGTTGELQMYVKMGRDQDNFYMYRTPVNAGAGQSAWLPEVEVNFQEFFNLRQQLQNAYMHRLGVPDSLACTGVDSAIIVASALPATGLNHRYAACANGYMVYTVQPGVTPPNLGAVQEMAVGIVRVAQGGGPTAVLPGDTLELWVDDIRLANVVNATGYASQMGATLQAGDLGNLRVDFMRRDPNFRQLGDQPSFQDQRTLELSGTLHMERLLPARWNLAAPLTVTRILSTSAPAFLVGSDLMGGGVGGLRTPRDAVATYSVVLRADRPITGSVLAPLVNHLSAAATLNTGDMRDVYSTGASQNLDFGLNYDVSESGAPTPLPDWMRAALGALPGPLQGGPITALERGTFRWRPTEFQLSSGITHNDARQSSYLSPSTTGVDSASLSLATDRLWRNGGVIAFQPTDALTAQLAATSLRDLRQYGDTSPQAVLASAERQRLFGVDVGMERQRTMQGSVHFAPRVSDWLRPRFDFGTQYMMLRDPNSTSLLLPTDSAGHPVLPALITASQTLGLGVAIDPGQLVAAYSGDTLLTKRITRLFSPIDVDYSRSLISALDGAPRGGPLALQLGLGNVGGYRYVHGAPASSAGFTGTWTANAAVNLPFGVTVVNRYRRTSNQNWVLRLDSTQAQVAGLTTTFPDFNVRWNWRPPGATMRPWVTAVNATVGYAHTIATASQLNALNTTAPDLSRARVDAYPVSGSITWGFGGLSTAAGYTLTQRVDSLPGSFARGRAEDVNVDVGRSFTIPSSWGLGIKNAVRARFGLQQTHTQSFVYADDGSQKSRLVDNGQSAINLNADTDLSETMQFTLQVSRIITYDNNLNTRLNQFVLSTILQIHFASGPLR
ncbi:MAG TPA: cell surface protein SprA [Gemmatimonadaceae bacterium]|nr:cell surface protein SprA [Gemmatimonadaceae bacterium]